MPGSTEGSHAERARVPVLLPVALDQTYDYLVEAGKEPPPAGSFVLVPFGQQSRIGIVWPEPVGEAKAVALSKMKTIDAV
ncbi:hypothetical protein ABTN15_19780, partial [Acinetobacter baumannii]